MPRNVSTLPYQIEGTVSFVGEPRQTKRGRWMAEGQLQAPRNNGRIDIVDVRFMGSEEGPLAVVKGDNGIAVGQVVMDQDQEGAGRGLTVFIYEWDAGSGAAPIVREAVAAAAGVGRK